MGFAATNLIIAIVPDLCYRTVARLPEAENNPGMGGFMAHSGIGTLSLGAVRLAKDGGSVAIVYGTSLCISDLADAKGWAWALCP